jgi:hypothetical protein
MGTAGVTTLLPELPWRILIQPSVLHPRPLLIHMLMSALEALKQSGHWRHDWPSDRPQYFAPSYTLWIENFLSKKNAGESRTFSPQMGTGFQIHCGTYPIVEQTDTVPIPRYTNTIRWTGYNTLDAEDQIVIASPNQWNRRKPMRPLPSEHGARCINKIQHPRV